jgi:antitoxin ParD1/3/4
MSGVEKISIALPQEMLTLVRDAVNAGEYASSSEVVREALREWSHRRAWRQPDLHDLRKAWREALADSDSAASADDVLDRLEKKYRALADKTAKPR